MASTSCISPYVHYFGTWLRPLDLPVFVIGAGGIIVMLVLGAMALERGVNALTRRALG